MSKVYFDLETLGLNPFGEEFKIVTAQIKIEDNEPIILKEWEIGEKELLKELVNIFSKFNEYTNIFVYNGYFDFGALLSRISLLFNNDNNFMRLAFYYLFIRVKWCDLMQYNKGYFVSLEKICRKYRISFESKYRGRDIHTLYHNMMYNEIIEHGSEDVEALYYLVKRSNLGERFL